MLRIWFVGNHRPYHYLDVPVHVYEELLRRIRPAAISTTTYATITISFSSRCRNLPPRRRGEDAGRQMRGTDIGGGSLRELRFLHRTVANPFK
nr:KTSC domain-containing protein [Sinorhizobium fredii]